MAFCHMTQLTNRNWRTAIAVMNDAQLSKYFDDLYLAKGILMFALSPTVIFTVLLSLSFCQFILHRKPMECKISIHRLFVYF